MIYRMYLQEGNGSPLSLRFPALNAYRYSGDSPASRYALGLPDDK